MAISPKEALLTPEEAEEVRLHEERIDRILRENPQPREIRIYFTALPNILRVLEEKYERVGWRGIMYAESQLVFFRLL